MILIFIMLLLYLISQFEAEQENQCVETAPEYASFGWMTSYLSSRGSQMNLPQNSSPVFVWGIVRHGTRYPTQKSFIKKVIETLPKLRDEIVQNHEKGRGKLSQENLDNLKNWKTSLRLDLVGELTPEGWNELSFLANKVKDAFPMLFKSKSKNLFTFQSSDTNRTKDSALAFSNELLGTNFSTISGNNITIEDELLQLYKHCPNYKKFVKNPVLLEEIILFEKSNIWHKTKSEISIRLGYRKILSTNTIFLIYDICAYENAWYVDTRSPFCAAFSTEDLKAIEYLNDLNHFHTRGYGNKSPMESMGCSIVRDMLQTLSNAAENSESINRGKFLFTHSETVVPTIVKLGLYQDDEVLKTENFQKMVEERKWRRAVLDSYASNIIAALYRLLSPNGFQNVVIFHQNERPVVIPQCTQNPCALEELLEIFQDVFDENQCNMNFCTDSESLKASLGYSYDVIWNIIILCSFLIKMLG